MVSGGVRVMSCPSKCTVPDRGRSSPEMTRRQVVFPAPLPPISARTSLGPHLEAHPEERLEVAVEGDHVLHLEQGRRRGHCFAPATNFEPR